MRARVRIGFGLVAIKDKLKVGVMGLDEGCRARWRRRSPQHI
jgi:hypothetical protein